MSNGASAALTPITSTRKPAGTTGLSSAPHKPRTLQPDTPIPFPLSYMHADPGATTEKPQGGAAAHRVLSGYQELKLKRQL